MAGFIPSSGHTVRAFTRPDPQDLVECPICFNNFPQKVIEQHAGNCSGPIAEGYESVAKPNLSTGAPSGAATGQRHEQVYWCNQVFVHPTVSRTNDIRGILQLYKAGGDAYVLWEPVEAETFNLTDAPPSTQSHDTIKHGDRAWAAQTAAMYRVEYRLRQLESVRRHVPRLGYSNIVLQLAGGLTLAPLYFHGGYNDLTNFFETLGQLVDLGKQSLDPNLYMVRKDQGPYMSVEDLHVLTHSPTPAIALRQQTTPSNGSLGKASRGLADWTILQLSKVKKVVEDLSAPHPEVGQGDMQRRPNAQILVPPTSQPAPIAMSDFDIGDFEIVSSAGPSTDASASLGANAVATTQSPAPQQAGDIPNSTEQKCNQSPSSIDDEPSMIEEPPACTAQPPPPVPIRERLPVNMDQWKSFFTSEGAVADPATVKALIFNNGLAPDVRSEAWPFLLGVHPWDSTTEQRVLLRKQRESEYAIYKQQWQSITPRQAERFSKFRDRRHRINKDVERTDRSHEHFAGAEGEGLRLLGTILLTHAFYNFDLAYVQGMSDLLAPILEVVRDEVDSFWCFAAYMDIMENNFQKDQNGVHTQLRRIKALLAHIDPELSAALKSSDADLHFCFRWVLVNLKREFPYHDIMRLWETIWTEHRGRHWVVFVCAAILSEYRVAYLQPHMGLDGLVMFTNDLACTMNLDKILARAEHIYDSCVDYDGTLPDGVRELLGPTAPATRRSSASMREMILLARAAQPVIIM